MSSVTSQNNDITLTARFTGEGHSLLLSYRVTNDTGGTVYLFDMVHADYDGSVYPLVDPCYATIEGGQLVLSRQVIPVPDGMRVETVNIPFVTAIKPGHSVDKTVRQVQPVFFPGRPTPTLTTSRRPGARNP
ncbi:hypothetical protein QW131_16045 [Roseibium salinum]|nr:hypothetical protein [Roseibium salinum]